MVSGPDVAPNLARRRRLLSAAAAAGASLAALPENFYMIGRHERDKVAVREPEGSGPISKFLSDAAKKHGIWIIGGHGAHLERRSDAQSAAPAWSTTTRAGGWRATTRCTSSIRGRRRALRRGAHARAGRAPGRRREPVRAARAFGLLRCALSRALPRARGIRPHVRALRLHRADRRGPLGNAAARARSRTRPTWSRRPGRHARGGRRT